MKTQKNEHTSKHSPDNPAEPVQKLPCSLGTGLGTPVAVSAAVPDTDEAGGGAIAAALTHQAPEEYDPVLERINRQNDYLSRLHNGKIPRVRFHLADGEDIVAMIPEKGCLVKAWMVDDALGFIAARMQKNVPWTGSSSIARMQEYIVRFAEAGIREEMYELCEATDLLTEIRLGLQTLQRFLKLMDVHANDGESEPPDEVTA